MEIIVALDMKESKKLTELTQALNSFKPFYKVGLELFYKDPSVVVKLKDQGFKVFLDLKLHDIPNTVEKALLSLLPYSPDIINVHALGGRMMMEKAAQVFAGTNTKLIAVTQLTSTDEMGLKDLGIELSMEGAVLKLAALAKLAGIHGVVASALEVPTIKEKLGSNFITVTPGIRLETGDAHDQKRVVTPKMAKNLGSDYIVVGRPITESVNPAKVYEMILKDIQ